MFLFRTFEDRENICVEWPAMVFESGWMDFPLSSWLWFKSNFLVMSTSELSSLDEGGWLLTIINCIWIEPLRLIRRWMIDIQKFVVQFFFCFLDRVSAIALNVCCSCIFKCFCNFMACRTWTESIPAYLSIMKPCQGDSHFSLFLLALFFVYLL